MSNLRPEKRVNKHGVAVTKHVRADNSSSARGAGIPSPSVASDSDVETLLGGLKTAIARRRHGIPGLVKLSTLHEHLDTFSGTTVASYAEAIRNSPDEGYDELLVGVLNNRSNDSLAAYSLEVAKLDPSPERNAEHDRGYRFREVAKQVVYGLSAYSDIDYAPPENITDHDDPKVASTLGLIRLTLNLFSHDEAYGIEGDKKFGVVIMRLDNSDVAELVLQRPEDADRIAEVILERRTMDARVITDMLDTASSSLRDGVL